MGRLRSVGPIELVFERVDCEPPEIGSIEDDNIVYRGDSVVIVSRYAVTSAEMVCPTRREMGRSFSCG